MSPSAIEASYLALLRRPGAAAAFLAASIARLSYATVSLSLLLTVQAATGSYTIAGAALGAFGLPALVDPFKSRLIDRVGRRRVLTPLGIGYALVLAATAASPDVHAPASTYIGLAALAGLLTPPVGPVMRGIWAGLTPPGQARHRAYSLDAVSEEAAFAAGPFLVAALVSTSSPAVALAVTAALALLGSAALAAAPAPHTTLETIDARSGGTNASDHHHPARGRRLLGPLVLRDFRWVTVAMLAIGLGTTALEVAVVARATEVGDPASAGLLLGVLSVASAAGGLLWGRRQHRRRPSTQLLGLISVLAAGVTAAGLLTPLPALAAALAMSGLAVAPSFVVAYVLGDALVPADMRIEASTWIATAHNLGGAAGAFAAGAVIDAVSAQAPFLFAAVALVVTGLALLPRRP